MTIEIAAVLGAIILLTFLYTYSSRLHKPPDAAIVTYKREAHYWPGKEGGGKFTEKDKQTVYDDYKGRCMYCNANVRIGEPDTRWENFDAAIRNLKEGQFEHIVPAHFGGSDAIENRGLACEQCNIARGIKPTQQMLAWLRERGNKIYYGKKVEIWKR